MKCGVNCFTAFNGWKSERLAYEHANGPSFKAFQEDIEKLKILPDLVSDLSEREMDIVRKSQLPREFILSKKDRARIGKVNDEKAYDLLLKLTGQESDLICKYFFPASTTLRENTEPSGSLKVICQPVPFTHGG